MDAKSENVDEAIEQNGVENVGANARRTQEKEYAENAWKNWKKLDMALKIYGIRKWDMVFTSDIHTVHA